MDAIEFVKNKKMIESTVATVLSKFPYLGTAFSELKIEMDNNEETASTDGVNVTYNSNFMMGLSEDERAFVLAHEVMHIAFDHILRGENKDGEEWNIATDAVINQLLEHSGLPITKGINMPEAYGKSAEEMYEILMKNKQNASKNKDNQKDDKGGNSGNGGENATPPNNHKNWDKDKVKNKAEEKESQEQKPNQGNENQGEYGNQDKNVKQDKSEIEKNFTDINDKIKEEKGRELIRKLQDNAGKSAGSASNSENLQLGEVGDATKRVNWKKILKKELAKDECMWSYRRADADNYYQARIDSLEQNNKARVQILLDTSGSVSGNLLKNFLREIKPLLKDADIEVGCFDTKFYGFHKVKNAKDIDTFRIVGRGGTDFHKVVESFDRDSDITKIVFTDGEDIMELTDNKYKRIIWIVFDNTEFTPAVGRVINVSAREINKSHIIVDEMDM